VKLRVRFSKTGKVRFTSHRDVARIWERALRRAEVPVTYSGGFSPRPRIHFGLALATGAESHAEYLDVDVDDAAAAVPAGGGACPLEALGGRDALAQRLDRSLPIGIDVMALDVVRPGEPSLQEAVTSCSWSFSFPGLDEAALAGAVERALASTTLPVTRERKGRSVTDDLRPQLLDLHVSPEPCTAQTCAPSPADAAGASLLAELGTQPRTVRPAELVAVLDPTSSWPGARVLRLSQWIAHDDGRREPLVAPPRSWACTEVRAS